jgi:Rieske Fe-S protein
MDATPGTPENPARRTVVAAAGTAGLAAVLAACGGGGTSSSSGTSAPSTPSSESSATPSGSAAALTKTAAIPVGGGKIFPDKKVVVTQPTSGDFKAFSAICTHEGCTVSQVKDGTIDCPCHGSKFHVADGSVAHGPAMRPLPPKKITVQDGSITLT